MPELDLDAIERRANNQRATDEDLIDLVAEVRRLRAAVDAALAVHRSRELHFTHVPPGSSIEEAARIYESTPKRVICDAEHENYPCATVRALTPAKQEQGG
jgi:hypothetical protein